jgi:spore coat polysaccharide biosynthesis protein SpsF (cytidylyltransferase family)
VSGFEIDQPRHVERELKTVAILQARMGSKRLPGKVLLPAAGKPLIRHMLERVQRSKLVDEFWVATSEDRANDPLVEEINNLGAGVFRGSESDVLSRYETVARQTGADWIVRLTGDCPLHDPAIIDDVVQYAVEHACEFDYVCNSLLPTYPDGLDVEVFTYAALAQAQRDATTSLQREHVTPFIHRYHEGPGPFRVGHFKGPADFSHLRWTVDEVADYQVVKEIIETLYLDNPNFGWMDVLALVTRRPELIVKNSPILRNEGYFQALAKIKQSL